MIASLFNSHQKAQEELLNENKSLIQDLLQVLTHPSTDPKLLTAIVSLALNILQKTTVNENPKQLEEYILKIKSCVKILPYLGMGKYEKLLQETNKYNKSAIPVTDVGEEINLQNQVDPIIHDLFKHIIQLIGFFCQQNAH